MTYTSRLQDSIGLAVDTGITDIIITGDFNLNTLVAVSCRKVELICQQNNLVQCITNPTHFTENSSSIIDLLFVSNENSVVCSGVGDPFLLQNVRYHCPVFGIFKFNKPIVKHFKRRIWRYDQADFALLRREIATLDWESFKDTDVNKYAINITSAIDNISKSCIPSKDVNINPLEPPWMNGAIKKSIRKRKRAYRKVKRTDSPTHWHTFRRLRNEVVSLIRTSKSTYLDNLSNKLKSSTLSSKDWWRILKSFILPSSKTSIPPLLHPVSGEFVSDELSKANLLNEYFTQQTIIGDSNQILPALNIMENQSILDSILISPVEVSDAIACLAVGKASGPDGVSNRVLLEARHQLSIPLCNLFNSSLQSCQMPSSWKIANVCAVYKKGDSSHPSNYRPISLLNTMEKVFERIIFKYVFNFLRDTQFFTCCQSGFMPGDSTVNQLTFLYNTFCKALDNGLEVRVVFFDISKAFDKVWHRGLLHKLEQAGIKGDLLTWFSNYLSLRHQRVVLPGCESNVSVIEAGVPQGSILGPLLFLVYINDIVTDIDSNINLFADDTSLFLIVNSPTDAANQLQSDIIKITDWANKWLVKFNPAKSESLVISRKVNKPLHPSVTMFDSDIPSVRSHKHLGLFFSDDGSWHQHIKYITDKAWTRINIMRRLKMKIDRKSLEIIYTSFIRPIIEYSDVVWDNCSQYEKLELDKIQNEAARIVTGCTKLVSLDDLYAESGWETLGERRRKHKLVLFFKMFKGYVPDYLSSLVPRSVGQLSGYNLRNVDSLLCIPSRTVLYSNSFLPSVINDWNALPDEAKRIDTIIAFKTFLNRNKPKPNIMYFFGDRRVQVLHTRLRTRCSSLNQHLHSKNIVESPNCRCGLIESSYHFFFECTLYDNIRPLLFNTVSIIAELSLRTLFYGDDTTSRVANQQIFTAVHKYILSSKRFDN